MPEFFTPREYQRTGIKHILANPHAALFLDMGLGKTVQVLTAVNLMQDRMAIGQTLVVAPRRVCRLVWPAEARKWQHTEHMRVSVVRGRGLEAVEQLQEPADIHCVTYETLPWLFGQYAKSLKRWPWDMVVFDESTKMKKANTERFNATCGYRGKGGVLDKFQRRVILTGTPAPKSYEDLWAQIYLLDEGERLGKFITHFRDRWTEQWGKERFQKRMKHGSCEEISRRIKDITLCMLAEDWLDVPPLVTNVVDVELPDKARKVYDELEAHFFAMLDTEEITAANAGVQSGKLRQMAAGFVYDEQKQALPLHDEKLDALEDILEGTGDQVLVCYEFQAELEALRKRWPDALVMGAGTTDRQADKIMERWNAKTAGVVFCNPASVGHGLNFQYGGHTLVWLTTPWSLELWQQMIGRLKRQGQTQPIIMHVVQCKDTVDLAVAKGNREKDGRQTSLLDQLKQYRASRK